MNKAEIQAMKGAVGARLEEQGEFKRLGDELASLNSKIERLEDKTKFVMWKTGVRLEDFLDDARIAFSASLTTHTQLKANRRLVFECVHLNVGDCYNASTGEFVAPKHSRYLFSLTVRAEYHKYVSAEIMAGPDVIARVTSGYGDIDRATASVTVVKELNKDDVVYVRQANDKTGDFHGHGHTAFCGAVMD